MPSREGVDIQVQRTLGVVACVCALIASTAIPARSAPGDLDVTFGHDGKVITLFAGGFALARDVAIQADGKIVAVGQASGGRRGRFALARYNHNGSLDSTFGRDGKVTTRFEGGALAYAVAIQADGKIVAAGGTRGGFALVRYRPDGRIDPTFSGDGKLITTIGADAGALDVAIQEDGKILAVGRSESNACCPRITKFALVRYEPDGTLDGTFGGDGRVTTSLTDGYDAAAAVALQSDGKIVAVGTSFCPTSCSKFALARYDAGGALDAAFGTGGTVVTQITNGFDGGSAVAIQADGKIVAGGRAGHCCEYTGSFGLIRLDTDGTLDPAFGGDGTVQTNFTIADDEIGDLVIDADGNIVAAGSAGYDGATAMFAVARYDTEGTLDPSFSANGRVRTRFTAGTAVGAEAALQGNGKLVVAGWACEDVDCAFALARYLAA
jgi:uncharacterized delta-60 repeat protein